MDHQHARRVFLKQVGLLTAALTLTKLPAIGQTLLQPPSPKHNIPLDKQLNPIWIKSLYTREQPTHYKKSNKELKYLGMPVSGLHTGTVYAGGDGRLWLWQIYNQSMEGQHEGITAHTTIWNDGSSERKIRPRDGAAYVNPPLANSFRVLEQGFALELRIGDQILLKELNEDCWDEVIFKPTYPIATIEFRSIDLQLWVEMQVYSPFIPLDPDNSALPATILRITVVNDTTAPVEARITGWMENGANKLSAASGKGFRRNTLVSSADSTSIFMDFDATDDALKTSQDAGSVCLTLHGKATGANTAFNPWPVTTEGCNIFIKAVAHMPAPEKLVGSIQAGSTIAPGGKWQADYSISWHFNHPHPQLVKLVHDAAEGYWYGRKFATALQVSQYIQDNFTYLTGTTELWTKTWYEGTLPYWFLERTFNNIGTLATANTYRFASGRFWSWEGIGACGGTCTHVWQYAHSMARVFPTLERDMRQRVDLGTGFIPDTGAILFRGEMETRPAIDGQAGTILRFYREHLMSPDNTFLQHNWASMKKTVQFMLAQDKNKDGMTDTPMENTLDAVWEGEIAWIVGLCIAAAAAAEQMAIEMKDTGFAKVCHDYVANGRRNMEQYLFNGEYFIHRPDAVQGRKQLGSYNTCHIDQVYGQSWAFQVGLPRILDKDKTLSALQALWKYNFTTDVGPYIKTHIGGRPYALAGEAGMIMNTNPHNEPRPYGESMTWQLEYFHECMSGFEHQVAAHLMAEGMTDESLVLTRAIHDRHHPAKRNPFNEIECSDHYARAMASYGTFISACGFTCHGPQGRIGFAPRIQQENFKAAFTAPEGWGTYAQSLTANGQQHRLQLAFGKLRLKTLDLIMIKSTTPKRVTVTVNGVNKTVKFKMNENQVEIDFQQAFTLETNHELQVEIIC
ncbi:MAG: hypothetical protein JO154_04415 [Chitinophaga sp.]|uniref:GH116 family glycosyl hydrolase n=1 Tax=Chitinophaga sp. TaxID=1869181 RepID=UPI0025BBCBAF|nr:GH116 family glycosyl hydrolase [Chitinophaga sp.]MBV8251831.1 hypothetical protein [Chitinophaga sp.]